MKIVNFCLQRVFFGKGGGTDLTFKIFYIILLYYNLKNCMFYLLFICQSELYKSYKYGHFSCLFFSELRSKTL